MIDAGWTVTSEVDHHSNDLVDFTLVTSKPVVYCPQHSLFLLEDIFERSAFPCKTWCELLLFDAISGLFPGLDLH